MPEKISFVFTGDVHPDPTTALATLYAMKQCHEQNIPIAFGLEVPRDISLQQLQQEYCTEVELLMKVIKLYSLEEFFLTPDKKLATYFDLTRREHFFTKVEQIRKTLIEKPDKSEQKVNVIQDLTNPQRLLELLARYQAKPATLRILDFLIKNHLSYIPIDIHVPLTAHLEVFAASTLAEQEKILSQYEAPRMANMTNSILEKARKLESTGGIFFCKVGALHVEALAAAIRLKYPDNKISVLHCYSDCYTAVAEKIQQSSDKKGTIVPLHFQFKDNKLMINKEFKGILNAHMQEATHRSQGIKTRSFSSRPKAHSLSSTPHLTRSLHSNPRAASNWSIALRRQPEIGGSKLLHTCIKSAPKYGAAALMFGLLGYKLSKPQTEKEHQSLIKQGPG